MNDKIGNYYLDDDQQQIVVNESAHILVVAGAGSGKTLTILGKINYLVKKQGINPSEILCLSFTKASANSLKDKILKDLSYDMKVFTFHKLSLEILKNENINYNIADSETLERIIHEFFETTILNFSLHMKKVLNYFKINTITNIKKKYIEFYKTNNKMIQNLENLLSTFLHLLKCNNYTLQDFSIFLNKAKRIYNFNYKKEKIFLVLALNIYIIYNDYLDENNEIDFDDMIVKATKCIKENGINQVIKYVIIDEYQDTSYIRFLLVKSILDSTSSKLMVVGDDFQSIYRFTGCDVSLFLNFKQYFSDAKIMKIENTYRNSIELIKEAGNFVMRNKYQIKKHLKSSKHLEYPIKIILYKNIKEAFVKLVIDIHNKSKKPILVLGRNNNDVYMVISDLFKLKDNKIIYIKDESIDIYYLTVHKSKGLEEENVIVINLIDDLIGFPCQIKDESVLRFVNNNYKKYPYSEERRLFYVAITRTKNYVYLLAPKTHESIFIKELKKDSKRLSKVIDIINI